MSVEMTEDAAVDAGAVFALAPTLAAVVLHSDIPAVSKHRRKLPYAAAKRCGAVSGEVLKEARAGNLAAAKGIASKDTGVTPRTVWWLESEAELSSHLAKIYQSARRQRLVLGWDADLLNEKVALVQIWWDY